MYEPENRQLLREQARRSRLPCAPVVAPQVTSRPPRASDRTLFGPGRLADMFDDDVDAAPVRQPLDFLGDVLLVVVDHLVRARAPRPLQLVVRAGRREHAGAVQPRDLDRRLADAAARRQHQHVVAALADCARVISMCQAVRNVSGNAAACTKSMSSGIATRFCTGTFTSSA